MAKRPATPQATPAAPPPADAPEGDKAPAAAATDTPGPEGAAPAAGAVDTPADGAAASADLIVEILSPVKFGGEIRGVGALCRMPAEIARPLLTLGRVKVTA